MGLFGRKKNKNDAPAENQQVQTKPSESLGTVLDESVPSASLEIIRTNDVFALENAANGDSVYLVATLDVADIGGLNKHMKSDQDKGQFIEEIANGNIAVHVSAEGIEAGKFVIIPTSETLDNLDEFMFLSDSSRFDKFIPTLVYVDKMGNMDFREIENARVSFDWFTAIKNHAVSVDDAVAAIRDGVAVSEKADNEADELSEKIVAESENESVSEDDFEGEFGEDFKPESSSEEDFPEDFGEEIPDSEPSDDGFDGFDENEVQPDDIMINTDDEQVECPNCHTLMDRNYPCPNCGFTFGNDEINNIMAEQDSIEEVSVAETNAAYERTFHAGDVELKIESQPFDVQYVQSNKFVPISEDRGDGWLDGYATQLVKNANAELENMHIQNVLTARRRYISVMTDEVEKIAQKIDMNDSSNPYYKMRKAIVDDAATKRLDVDTEVSKRRNELREGWEKDLTQIKAAAAAAAERTYRDKHDKAHDEQLRLVEQDVNDEIEIAYNANMTELNQKRSNEAKRLFDIATTQTLIAIGESYNEMLAEEDEKRAEYLKKIDDYLDTHRKDEMARVTILDEQQRQKDEASKVADEFTRKIQRITADNDAICDKLHQEIEAAKKHEETVKSDCANKLSEAKALEVEREKKYNELLDKYANLDADKTKIYEERMKTLEEDKISAQEHLAHVDITHNKYNKISIIVWVAVTVAFFTIGLLVGGKVLGPQAQAGGGTFNVQFSAPDEIDGETDGETPEVAPQNADDATSEASN